MKKVQLICRRLSLLTLIAMAFTASTASAGVNVWTTNGPNGQQIRALAIDPANPATVYAGTYGGGVFKSTDGGGSWTATNTGLTSTSVNALAIDPSTPVILYAGTSEGGVFKSINGGASWINTGLINAYVQVLAIDPSNPAMLYAGTQGSGVYKSTDAGGTWAVANNGLPPFLYVIQVESLAVDPVIPATLYAGMSGPMVFKSTDSGGSWSGILGNPWDGGDCPALAIDPAAHATVYAGIWTSVFKSADGGSSWTDADTGLTDIGVAALAIDPSEPTTLYAGTRGRGVLKSINGGTSWTSMNAGLSNLFVNALAIDPSNPARLHAGTDAGVYAFLTAAVPFGFYTVPPCRVVDTRNPTDPHGGPSLVAGSGRTFIVAGQCGIPATATAVALNAVVVSPTTGPGYLTVYPGGAALSQTSTINYVQGDIRANNAIVPLGANGDIAVYCAQGSGTADLVVDVFGYFQ
jgi:photosystem II stability/assembly factor-like uncharacterized protein